MKLAQKGSEKEKEKEKASKTQKMISLPRGGIVVNTGKRGPVQFGMPPETIKDSMALGIQVPNYFVFPRELFDRTTGISVAEAEFPAYFNFFILKKRIKFIATPEQEFRVRRVFRETLLGPEKIDLRKEVCRTFPEDRLPDLEKEARYIRTFNEIDELFEFIHFDSTTHVADLGEGVQIIDHGDEFAIIEDGKETARTASTLSMPASALGRRLNVSKTFTPPLFGVTILGSSHGFDPEKKTTGFVLWVNRRGIVVDPPLHSAAMLHTSGVPSRLVDTVILTHCHADHDSGTFQKILDEHQVTVITTPTIMGSFLRKYSALSGLPEAVMRRLFNFRPILLGEPLMVHGGEFQFWYTIHTIPTVAFEAYYSGKSVYYSADTCYEPARIRDMVSKGVMKQGRANFFLEYNWHHNVVLHEAGVPPIHTPLSVLKELVKELKDRLYLVHISEKTLPKDSGLRIAKEGVENSIIIDVFPHQFAEAIEILKLVEGIDMFRGLRLGQAGEILQYAKRGSHSAGSVIIQEGTPGDAFYVVATGVVMVHGQGWVRSLIAGDYFGEMAIVSGDPRTATVTAKTNVEVIRFSKHDFLSLIRGNPETIRYVRQLIEMRKQSSWELISSNQALMCMTNSQKTSFQAIMHKKDYKQGETLWKKNEPAEQAFLISSGCFVFSDMNLQPFTRGAFLAEVNGLLTEAKHTTTVMAQRPGSVYYILRKDLIIFWDQNPGIQLSFLGTFFVDSIKQDPNRIEQSDSESPEHS